MFLDCYESVSVRIHPGKYVFHPLRLFHSEHLIDTLHNPSHPAVINHLNWSAFNLFISESSIFPFPSTSYILKAHCSFSVAEAAEVRWRAKINSLKSMVPLASVSKARKASWLNSSADPQGNTSVYIWMNICDVNWPEGESLMKPLYHSWILLLLLSSRIFQHSVLLVLVSNSNSISSHHFKRSCSQYLTHPIT